MPISDRDLIVALFNVVGSLAERLTGQRPSIRMELEPGRFVELYPVTGPATVKWETVEEPSAVSPDGESSPHAAAPTPD